MTFMKIYELLKFEGEGECQSGLTYFVKQFTALEMTDFVYIL